MNSLSNLLAPGAPGSARRGAALGLAALMSLGLAIAPGASASAAEEAPIGLGTAGSFGVLAGSTVTNTNPTVISGSVGLAPGTSVTGFPPGLVKDGTTYAANAVAVQAKADLATAFLDAASRLPDPTDPDAVGLTELTAFDPVPGVYSGGALQLTGTLTLDGDADDVWIFQAASTLATGSGSEVVLTGAASPCNVFWQVGSSATIGSGSAFTGTVLAAESITAVSGATVQGRLLAQESAVTLDNNVITRPVGCAGVDELGPDDSPDTTPPGTDVDTGTTPPGTSVPPSASVPPVTDAAPPATPIAGRADYTG